MNRTFDYNGVQIAPSRPIQKLRTVKKTIYIDSADRDIVKYPRNGDFVVYLPRAYEKVVSINLKSAEFPNLFTDMNTSFYGGGALAYSTCLNTSTALDDSDRYFLIEIEGLNKSDESSVGADRSGYTDSVFAKIQITPNALPINYSDLVGPRNCQYYQPAIGKLDRLHIRTRLHTQRGSTGTTARTTDGYIFWTKDQTFSGESYDFGLTLEIETLENSFDDFSAIETRIGERSDGTGFYGC